MLFTGDRIKAQPALVQQPNNLAFRGYETALDFIRLAFSRSSNRRLDAGVIIGMEEIEEIVSLPAAQAKHLGRIAASAGSAGDKIPVPDEYMCGIKCELKLLRAPIRLHIIRSLVHPNRPKFKPC